MVRFATIGTNVIVDQFMNAALKQEDLHYEAVYSRNQDTADAFARKYKAVRTFTDLTALAGDDGIDAVYIASPNSLHYEQAALLLSHGKHILCEKAITSNLDELKSLTDLSERSHAILLEAVLSVHTPGWEVLTGQLNRVGKIRRASFCFCQYSSRYDKFKSGSIENAFNPAFSSGALMDIGVYCVHPLVRLFGLPKEIKTDAILLGNGIDGAGTILARYDTMQAELVYSKISAGRVPSQIQGEDGTITINSINNPHEIIFYDRKGNSEILYQGSDKPDMTGEIREWIRLIKLREEGVGGGQKAPEDNPHSRYSLMALQLMDEARAQLGIRFPADQK